MADFDNEHLESYDGAGIVSLKNQHGAGVGQPAQDADDDLEDTLRQDLSDGPLDIDHEYDVVDDDEYDNSRSMITNQVLASSTGRGQPRGAPKTFLGNNFLQVPAH